ncbi:MAG: YiiQ family protein [Sphingomonadales bacterium]|nr:YiiQ family protein [Sphingomonadales bacterium]NCP50057.1 YiiQ family protein [Sphingomonadales bacterium]
MHSKRSPNRMRRMTLFLIPVGLGLSVTAHAAEPDSPDEMQSEIPAPTLDTDGDGLMDAWDRSGDGQPDAWDSDGDGQPDLLDNDGDGQPD